MRGVTVWFTGLPGSGKSTVARHLASLLGNRGVANEVLDGDQVRKNLSKGLGFSREDRDSNVARIGVVCELLTRNGVVAIAACVSPYVEAREAVRRQVGDFVEVYVATSPEDCERRDQRGRYEAARRGEIRNFTGVDDPYEEPTHPDVRVDCGREPPELCAARVLALLEEKGYVRSAEGAVKSLSEEEKLERKLRKLGYA
jgi:adenylyl-sulfate kinase